MADFIFEFVNYAGRLEHRVVRAMTREDARKALDAEGISYNWLVSRESLEGRATRLRPLEPGKPE
jgi:hypothetical protein